MLTRIMSRLNKSDRSLGAMVSYERLRIAAAKLIDREWIQGRMTWEQATRAMLELDLG